MVKTRRMQNPIEKLRSMSTKSASPIFNNFDSVTKRPNNSLSKSYNVSHFYRVKMIFLIDFYGSIKKAHGSRSYDANSKVILVCGNTHLVSKDTRNKFLWKRMIYFFFYTW